MRISHFFIDRPIFAAVVSIVFLIVGGVSYSRLPVAQYPEIAPPTINVTGPISRRQRRHRRLDRGRRRSSSRSTASRTCSTCRRIRRPTGASRSTVTFDLGTNLDIAQVQVQNRVAIAQPRLPVDVRNIGVTVTKSSPDLMMVVHLYSPDKSRDSLFISNYATLRGHRRR